MKKMSKIHKINYRDDYARAMCGRDIPNNSMTAQWKDVTCKHCLTHVKVSTREGNKPISLDKEGKIVAAMKESATPKTHMKMDTCDQAVCAVGRPKKSLVDLWSKVTCKSCHKVRARYNGLDAETSKKKQKKPAVVHKKAGADGIQCPCGGDHQSDTNSSTPTRPQHCEELPPHLEDFGTMAMMKTSSIKADLTELIKTNKDNRVFKLLLKGVREEVRDLQVFQKMDAQQREQS
jgi:hypothetical protein